MSIIEKRWRKTGLLDSTITDSLDAEILAQNLNDCATLLISEVPNGTFTFTTDQEFKAGTLLPIIVRLFIAGMRVLNMRILYDNYSQYLVANPPTVYDRTDNLTLMPCDANYVESYLEYITTDDRIDPIMENA